PQERLREALNRFDIETASQIANPLSDTDKLIKHAIVLAQHSEWRLSMNILRAVLCRESNHPDALKWMGICLKEVGRLEEALKCFRALVDIRRCSHALFLVAETHYLLERDDDAFSAYHNVLKSLTQESPMLFDIYKSLGNIHVRAGDY